MDRYGYDTKYAGHIVRLGFQGEEILLSGKMTLPMPEEQRQLVLKVRTGGYTLAGVSEVIIDAEKRLQAAYEKSTLRLWPDKELVEKWMLRTYLTAWRAHELDAL